MSNKNSANTKELEAQKQVNYELKQRNQELKDELLILQKKLAQYDKEKRNNPLSLLTVLSKELDTLYEAVPKLADISGVNSALQEQLRGVCIKSFELLNLARNRQDKTAQTK